LKRIGNFEELLLWKHKPRWKMLGTKDHTPENPPRPGEINANNSISTLEKP
jgi:hypothetical protein